jgi:hypothetical protein
MAIERLTRGIKTVLRIPQADQSVELEAPELIAQRAFYKTIEHSVTADNEGNYSHPISRKIDPGEEIDLSELPNGSVILVKYTYKGALHNHESMQHLCLTVDASGESSLYRPDEGFDLSFLSLSDKLLSYSAFDLKSLREIDKKRHSSVSLQYWKP